MYTGITAPARSARRGKRRVVGEPQVLPKPHQGRHAGEAWRRRSRRVLPLPQTPAHSATIRDIFADTRNLYHHAGYNRRRPPPRTIGSSHHRRGSRRTVSDLRARLLGISAHIIDSLAQAGGQCTELYPDKPIYDIPALPVCGAQELIDRLLEQAKPFNATFHLGQEVTEVQRRPTASFWSPPPRGTRLSAGAVVIAGGVGSFQPRRLSARRASRSSRARACTTASSRPRISTAGIW